MTERLVVALMAILGSQALCGCPLLGFPSASEYHDAPAPPPIEPVVGPEHPEILQGLHGWILEREYRGRAVIARELPTLAERTIPVKSPIMDLSGPDETGRFVYSSGEFLDEFLHVVSIGSGVEEDFHLPRTGPRRYIHWFALAPHGGNLAIGFTTEKFWSIGNRVDVELWNIDTHEHRGLDAPWVVEGHWFPDAKRLLVETITPRPSLGLDYLGRDIRLLHQGSAEDVAIKILDVESGSIGALRAGGTPCLSPDGTRMTYLDRYRRWQVRNVTTGEEFPLTIPGALGDPYAWIGPDIVLYPARPTEGQEPGILRTGTKFPRANWTAKAARIGGYDFVTVSESVGRFQSLYAGGISWDR